jgi:hypothetical protein
VDICADDRALCFDHGVSGEDIVSVLPALATLDAGLCRAASDPEKKVNLEELWHYSKESQR